MRLFEQINTIKLLKMTSLKYDNAAMAKKVLVSVYSPWAKRPSLCWIRPVGFSFLWRRSWGSSSPLCWRSHGRRRWRLPVKRAKETHYKQGSEKDVDPNTQIQHAVLPADSWRQRTGSGRSSRHCWLPLDRASMSHWWAAVGGRPFGVQDWEETNTDELPPVPKSSINFWMLCYILSY